MKITNAILKEKKALKGNGYVIKLPAFIASFFSVLFSLSIVFELSNIVDGIVLGFLSVFTVLFLMLNEKIKVKEIKQFYAGKKIALIPFGITFVISVILSSLGIYFWTNKSFKQEQKLNTNTIEKISRIKASYSNKTDSVLSLFFEDTKQYARLDNDLIYWKNKSAATLKERDVIREHIRDIELRIDNNREIFNQKNKTKLALINDQMENEISLINDKRQTSKNVIERNSLISYIFLVMILITEIGIIILNKDVVKLQLKISNVVNTNQGEKYMIARKLLQSLYLAKDRNNIVNMFHALHSPALDKLSWDDQKKFKQVKNVYNLFINLGILNEGQLIPTKQDKKILQNKIVLNEKNAFKKFDNYYEKLFSL